MDGTSGEAGRVALPAGIEYLPAGPALSAALASLDLARLSSHDLYVVLGERARQVNHEQARLLAVLLEAARSQPGTLARRTGDLDQFAAPRPGSS